MMICRSIFILASIFLLSCVCGTRMEQHSSAAQTPAPRQDIPAYEAPSGDTARTAVLPPEVYGRYYKLQDVIRLDAQLQPIPRPAEADELVMGADIYERFYDIPHMMFTPGFSHIDYQLPDINEVRIHNCAFPEEEHPFFDSWLQKSNMLFFIISDTTYINPADSVITTSHKVWHECLVWYERRSTFRLLYADTARIVIRIEYLRQDSFPRYALPNYEEMHYSYVPQDSVFVGRTPKNFPSHEAADDYLIPIENLSLLERGKRRYPPMIIRPDTIRVGAEGGTFHVESTLAYNHAYTSMIGVFSYEGSGQADTVSARQLLRGTDCWVKCRNFDKRQYPVVVQPNEDPRPRQARITIQGDTNLPFMYHCIGRTPPSATLVILQEGAPRNNQ